VSPAATPAAAAATPPPRPPPVRPAATPRAASRHAAARRETADSYLTVNASPWGEVFVDGRRFADETPVYRRRVAPGDHVVVVRYAGGGASAPRRVRVGPGETRTLGFER
jgi:hypothetical protein